MSTPLRTWVGVIVITAALTYGAFLRIIPLSTQPYWMDEGYTINAVLSYQTASTDGLNAVLDSGATYECFLYCYPTALLAELFGNTATSYRFVALVAGILLPVVIFFFTRLLYPLPVALLASFFTLFSYFMVAWSTQARWYTLFTLFFWLALVALYKLLPFATPTPKTTPSYLWSIIWLLTLGLSTIAAISTHSIGILLIPIIFGTILIYWYHYPTYPKQLYQTLKTSRYGRVGLILTLLATAGLSLLAWPIVATFLYNLTLTNTLPYYASFFAREYWFILGLVFLAVVLGGRKEYWLLAIFFAYLLPLGLLTNIVHYRYLFHVTPALFILAAVGTHLLIEKLPQSIQKFTRLFYLVVIIGFFASGTGTFLPHDRYWLEADDPATLAPRPSYAYTPQPDWNAAYAAIAASKNPEDVIISSHPHFNKIFLNEPGYWLSYSYLGLDGRTEFRTADNREFYVGAKIIDTLAELQALTAANHGYIIFDYMAIDGRLAPDLLDYIQSTYPLIFEKQDNSYSHVWVYKF